MTTGCPVAGGASAAPTTSPTTTTSGAGRWSTTIGCSRSSASRASSRASRGSRSCASETASAPRSPASTPRRSPRFDDADVARLLADAGIVRNRGKIEAAIANARATLEVQADRGSLAALVWSYEPDRDRPAPVTMGRLPAVTPESTALAKDLKRRGFRFVGPTTAYAAMQASASSNDHLAGCHSHEGCEADRRSRVRRRPDPGSCCSARLGLTTTVGSGPRNGASSTPTRTSVRFAANVGVVELAGRRLISITRARSASGHRHEHDQLDDALARAPARAARRSAPRAGRGSRSGRARCPGPARARC